MQNKPIYNVEYITEKYKEYLISKIDDENNIKEPKSKIDSAILESSNVVKDLLITYNELINILVKKNTLKLIFVDVDNTNGKSSGGLFLMNEQFTKKMFKDDFPTWSMRYKEIYSLEELEDEHFEKISNNVLDCLIQLNEKSVTISENLFPQYVGHISKKSHGYNTNYKMQKYNLFECVHIEDLEALYLNLYEKKLLNCNEFDNAYLYLIANNVNLSEMFLNSENTYKLSHKYKANANYLKNFMITSSLNIDIVFEKENLGQIRTEDLLFKNYKAIDERYNNMHSAKISIYDERSLNFKFKEKGNPLILKLLKEYLKKQNYTDFNNIYNEYKLNKIDSSYEKYKNIKLNIEVEMNGLKKSKCPKYISLVDCEIDNLFQKLSTNEIEALLRISTEWTEKRLKQLMEDLKTITKTQIKPIIEETTQGSVYRLYISPEQIYVGVECDVEKMSNNILLGKILSKVEEAIKSKRVKGEINAKSFIFNFNANMEEKLMKLNLSVDHLMVHVRKFLRTKICENKSLEEGTLIIEINNMSQDECLVIKNLISDSISEYKVKYINNKYWNNKISWCDAYNDVISNDILSEDISLILREKGLALKMEQTTSKSVIMKKRKI